MRRGDRAAPRTVSSQPPLPRGGQWRPIAASSTSRSTGLRKPSTPRAAALASALPSPVSTTTSGTERLVPQLLLPELHPVHARHHEVEEDEARPHPGAELGERVHTVACDDTP